MTAAELSAAWSVHERAVEASGRMPPGALAASVWQTVAAGGVDREQTSRGVRGVGVVHDGIAAVWLAITDDTPVDSVSGLTQVALAGAWASDKLLYQRLDLPWPFVDRHWVLRSLTNRALAAAGVWERAWESAPEALASARARTDAAAFDAALDVPVNRGSWLLLALGDTDTLAIYQAQVQLGGSLPAGAAEQYAAATLGDLYASTARDARSMHRRYRTACVQPDGAGAPIPCFRD